MAFQLNLYRQLCMATGTGCTNTANCPDIPTNGVGGITTILLCHIGNGMWCCGRIHWDNNWVSPTAQIQQMGRCKPCTSEWYHIDKRATIRCWGVCGRFHCGHHTNSMGTSGTHLARGLLHGIHDVFPPSNNDNTVPVSIKKLCKANGKFETKKCTLRFDFDGNKKTIWLEAEKRAALLTILHHWIRGAAKLNWGIPFAEFKLAKVKLHHAFTALPEAHGLLSPCNWIIHKWPNVVYLHHNGELLEALRDMRTILHALIKSPTMCRDLVAGWPDYVGIVDASSHGVGGIVIGELSGIPPTVFCL